MSHLASVITPDSVPAPLTRTAYAASLGARRAEEARVIPFEVVILKNWQLLVARCHDNADAYVAEHPDCTVVRGWATYQPTPWGMLLAGHSIVQRADCSLVDITPFEPENERYRAGVRFIRHLGSEELFIEMGGKTRLLLCENCGDA